MRGAKGSHVHGCIKKHAFHDKVRGYARTFSVMGFDLK